MADSRTAFRDVELASEWGVSVATLRSWRRRRTGPRYVRVGRSVRYLRRDVEQFIDANTVEPGGLH
jgi:predicted DNA-binding transcriptional regulator AlpA